MKYFKAFEIVEKPLITWHLWADSTTAFNNLSTADKNLCLAEEDVPDFEFGVCPLKIVDGEITKRSLEEMGEYESEYISLKKEIDVKNLRRQMMDVMQEIALNVELTESITALEAELDGLKVLYNNINNPI